MLSPVDWFKRDDVQLFYSPIDQLVPNPYQPRQSITDSMLEDLVESIREKGVIQPILVSRTPNPDQYQILAGERRWRASRIAGLAEVPVLIRDSTPAEALELALIENIQREDLNCIEEAVAYQRLQEEFNLTQEEIARRVGKNRSTVANLLRILQLPNDIQERILNQEITMGHARALLSLEDPEDQRKLCRAIIARGLSVRQTEQLASKKGTEQPRSLAEPDAAIGAMERFLAQSFGTPVRIKRKGDRGSITLKFSSGDQLDRIMQRLGLNASASDTEGIS